MDYRTRTFCREVVNRFAFLIDEYGFTAPEIQDDYRPLHRTAISVTYRRGEVTVVTVLDLGYGGDETVKTTLATRRTADPAQVSENIARTGYQMRRALGRHADAIRTALTTVVPPQHTA